MRVGIAADHAGFEMKEFIARSLTAAGHRVTDFGARRYDEDDDYPDVAAALAYGIRDGQVDRGVALCGSGVGVAVVGNKVAGVRAALVSTVDQVKQAVEDDDVNMLCLGAAVTDRTQAVELAEEFLRAAFSGDERHLRRLEKVAALERGLRLATEPVEHDG